MHLDFRSLTVAGFQTFIKPAKFALSYNTAGLTFIRGRNEVEPALGANDAGKSTLFRALEWCLFGKTGDGLRNPDIKPWARSTATVVSIRLGIGDEAYTITRTAGPNKLLLNDQETSQEALNRQLGLDGELFAHTVLLGQARPLFFDLSPRDKLDLFSNTLQLDRWEARSDRAAEAAGKIRERIAALDSERQAKEDALAEINTLLKTTKGQSAAWEAERKKRVTVGTTEITKLAKELEAAQKRHSDHDLAYDDAMIEAKSLDQEVANLQGLLVTAQTNRRVAERELEELKRRYTELEREITAFGEADVCPICKQPIKGTELAGHKKELRARRTELQKQIKAGIPERVINTQDTLTKKLEQAERYRTQYRDKAERADSGLRLAASQVTELSTRLNELKTVREREEETVNPFRDQLRSLQKRANALDDEAFDLNGEIKRLNTRVERVNYWVKGFKDIRLYIIEEVLQELELATNALLPESGLHEWEVYYDVERETKSGTVQRGLNVFIKSPYNKDPVRWEVWGGGAGQRLRVVGALALSEVLLSHAGVTTNLEILDEPTRHLSTEGVADLCEYLALRARNLDKNIFYVDHMAVESAAFSDIVTVVKSKDGSRIER